MLRMWNEYSNAHFSCCECPKRIVKTLWALAICAIFGALCGAVCGAMIGGLLGFVMGSTYGLASGLHYLGIGLLIGATLGAPAGFFSGLIGATIGGINGWLIGGFFGGAFIGHLAFFVTGIVGAGAATFVADEVQKRSQHNTICRWILSTYNHSDLGEWRTRKLWIAPVFALYVLSLFVAFKLLSSY